MNILEMEPFATVRRHHAIEHATVTILTERNPIFASDRSFRYNRF